MDEGVIGSSLTGERLSAHCGTYLCQEREMHSIIECQGSHGGGERSAVKNTKVLLGREGKGVDIVLLERFTGGGHLARAEFGGAMENTDGGVTNYRQ